MGMSEETLAERYGSALDALRAVAEAYDLQGRLDDAERLWAVCEQLSGAVVLPAEQVRCLLGYASFLVNKYFLTGAREELMQIIVERARREAEALQDKSAMATALFLFGRMTYNQHMLKNEVDFTDTRAHLQQASVLWEAVGDSYQLAETLFYTGLTYDRQGPAPQSERFYQQALQLAEEQGNRWAASEAHRHLTDYTQGEERLAHALRSLELRQEMDFTRSLPSAQLLLAEILIDQSNTDRALEYCRQAEELARQMRLQFYLVDALLLRCDIAAQQGNPAEAREHLQQASVLAQQSNYGRGAAAIAEKLSQYSL
jgi:tetratricopeptide (TPR) repeat protein